MRADRNDSWVRKTRLSALSCISLLDISSLIVHKRTVSLALFLRAPFLNTMFTNRQLAVKGNRVSFGQKHSHKHGHLVWVGVLGLVAGLALLIYVPRLAAVSHVLLLFAGFHLVGAAVVLASAYVIGGDRLKSHLRSRRQSGTEFDFGWASAWTYGPWIASLILAATGIAVRLALPRAWPLAVLVSLIAVIFFVGGLITRTTGQYDYAVLPMVDLMPAGLANGVILDAGCGAGRTTLALARALKFSHIVGLDAFDSEYIEGGGRSLFENNMRLARLVDRVQAKQGSLLELPFDNDSFDAAVSGHAMDHLGQMKKQGLGEILRVLKPGGRFLLVVWVPSWTMVAVLGVLAFFLTSGASWKRMAADVGFTVTDEGKFNGVWFLVLKKPEVV